MSPFRHSVPRLLDEHRVIGTVWHVERIPEAKERTRDCDALTVKYARIGISSIIDRRPMTPVQLSRQPRRNLPGLLPMFLNLGEDFSRF